MQVTKSVAESIDAAADSRVLAEAIEGRRGHDQSAIANVVTELGATLLRKNMDYGCSAWQKPLLAPECDADAGIRVRMSDKVNRIIQLLERKPESLESIEDAYLDLAGYCVLQLAAPWRRTT